MGFTNEARRKAHSPAARRKAVATMKRNRALKLQAKGIVIPLDAVPGARPTLRKKYTRTVRGPNLKLLAQLIVAAWHELG